MHHSKLYFSKVQHFMMLVTFQSHLGSNVVLRVTVVLSLYALFRISFFQLTHLFYRPITVLFILFTVLSYPSHLRLAVLKPMALVVYAIFSFSQTSLALTAFAFLKVSINIFTLYFRNGTMLPLDHSCNNLGD